MVEPGQVWQRESTDVFRGRGLLVLMVRRDRAWCEVLWRGACRCRRRVALPGTVFEVTEEYFADGGPREGTTQVVSVAHLERRYSLVPDPPASWAFEVVDAG